MIRAQSESFLKIRNGFSSTPFPRRQKAEVVPCVWQSLGKAGRKFGCAFKALPRLSILLLFQVHASQPIPRLSARFVPQGQLECRFGLIEVFTLKEIRPVRE